MAAHGVRTSALLLSLSVLAGCAASASVRAVGPTSTARPTPSGSSTSTETTGSTGRPDGHGDPICPPTLLDAQAVIHPSRRATAAPTTLGVPLGAQAVRVCGYGWLGLNPVDRLLWSRDLGESQTRDLLAVVDAAVKPQTDLLGRVNCPDDHGDAALLRFSYGDVAGQVDHVDQDVLVHLTGCRSATSGHGTTLFRPDIVQAVGTLHG